MNRDLTVELPTAALRALESAFFGVSPNEPIIELIIRIRNEHINVREFSAFLAFLDGVYGRLSPRGFRSYSARPRQQLEITSINQGSVELKLLFDLLRESDVYRVILPCLIHPE